MKKKILLLLIFFFSFFLLKQSLSYAVDYLSVGFYSTNNHVIWEAGFEYSWRNSTGTHWSNTFYRDVDNPRSGGGFYWFIPRRTDGSYVYFQMPERDPHQFMWSTACVDPSYETEEYFPGSDHYSAGTNNITDKHPGDQALIDDLNKNVYVSFHGFGTGRDYCPFKPIPPPGNLSASSSCTSTTKAKMTFNWGSVNHGDGTYQLQYRKGDLPWDKDIDNIGQSQYTATGLDLNTVYYWRVRGHTTGNYPISEWTSVQSDRTDTNAACKPSTGAIGGTVYIDKNRDGNKDSGEGYTAPKVTKDNNTNNEETRNPDPDYSFGGLAGDSTHDILLSNFPDCRLNVTGNNPKTATVPNSNVDFRLVYQTYTIKGNIIWDADGNLSTTGDQQPYRSPGIGKKVTVTIVGSKPKRDTTTTSGHYSINGNDTDLDGVIYSVKLTNIKTTHKVIGGYIKNATTINCNDGVANFYVTSKRRPQPSYPISGKVYVDDGDGILETNGQDKAYTKSRARINVENTSGDVLGTATTYNTPPASRYGTYSVAGIQNGNYDVRLVKTSLASGYTVIPPNPIGKTVAGAPLTNVDFLLQRTGAETYTISGGLFIDAEPIGTEEDEPYVDGLSPETIRIRGPKNIDIVAANIDKDPDGYDETNLPAGDYTVAFPNLRQNYSVSYHPGSYSVTIGPGCSPASLCDASGDVSQLDFGITRSGAPLNPWYQGIGGDMRSDAGLLNSIPDGLYFSETDGLLSPGVVFNYDLGGSQGSKANANRWYVGDPRTNPVKFNGSVVKTSYGYINSILKKGNLVPDPLFSASNPPCGHTTGPDCNLKTNLDHGIYIVDGDLNFKGNAYNFNDGNDYIFLVKGNLTISTNIAVDNDTTVMFVVNENITVNTNVNEIAGIFSANKNFIVSDSPSDTPLTIEGNVIANAAHDSANTTPFINNRGARDNATEPAVQIIYRPDFVLNAPDLLKYTNYSFQEIAPKGR